MDKFLMICYVAADFVGPGKEIFRVTRDQLGIFVEAPAWVRQTLLYKWLLNDGSIRVAEDKPAQKALENDPMAGIAADGKAAEEEAVEAPASGPVQIEINEPKKKTRKKKDDAE